MDIVLEWLAGHGHPLVWGWMNYFGKFNPSTMKGTFYTFLLDFVYKNNIESIHAPYHYKPLQYKIQAGGRK